MRFRLAAVLLLLGACTPGRTASTIAPPTTTPPSSTVALPPDERPAPAPCLDGDRPFTDRGALGAVGAEVGDATTMADLEHEIFSDGSATVCERITLGLATAEGAPATRTGRSEAAFLNGGGVLRVHLPAEVQETAFGNLTLESDLVDRIFVVSDVSGDIPALAADVHFAGPASVRIAAASGPARIVIDLRAETGNSPEPARFGTDIVIVEPVGSDASYPLRVAGYARSGSGTVAITLAAGGVAITEAPAAGPYPWTAFEVVFPEGPIGPATISAGDIEIGLELG